MPSDYKKSIFTKGVTSFSMFDWYIGTTVTLLESVFYLGSYSFLFFFLYLSFMTGQEAEVWIIGRVAMGHTPNIQKVKRHRENSAIFSGDAVTVFDGLGMLSKSDLRKPVTSPRDSVNFLGNILFFCIHFKFSCLLILDA